MGEWKEYKLNEVYDFGSGLSKPSSEFGFGYGFLSYKDIFHNYFVPENLKELVNSTQKEQNSCSIHKGDVFLTRTSETDEELGMSCVALKDYPKATFNGFTKRLRPNGKVDIVPEYAGFYFRNRNFRTAVSGISSITTRASLNNEMLSSLSIVIPPIEEQKGIAETLKSLHDKIDLLHRQNKTLEQMAETLFRQWFVEEAEESWEVRPIYSFIEIQSGFAFKSGDFVSEGNYKLITIKNVQDGYMDLSKADMLLDIPRRMPNYCLLKESDILLSLTGNVGRCCLVEEQNLLLNQRVAKLNPKIDRDWAFTYMLFRQSSTKQILEELAKGTAQANLSPIEMGEISIQIPPDYILMKYSDDATPLIHKVLQNKKQINTLTHFRDTMLPKLMSGEVRVK